MASKGGSALISLALLERSSVCHKRYVDRDCAWIDGLGQGEKSASTSF